MAETKKYKVIGNYITKDGRGHYGEIMDLTEAEAAMPLDRRQVRLATEAEIAEATPAVEAAPVEAPPVKESPVHAAPAVEAAPKSAPTTQPVFNG